VPFNPRKTIAAAKSRLNNLPAKVESTLPAEQREEVLPIYSQYVPPRGCDVCGYTGVCSFHKPGHECAFGHLNQVSLTDNNLESHRIALVEAAIARARLGVVEDQISGRMSKDTDDRIKGAMVMLDKLEVDTSNPERPVSVLDKMFNFQVNVNTGGESAKVSAEILDLVQENDETYKERRSDE